MKRIVSVLIVIFNLFLLAKMIRSEEIVLEKMVREINYDCIDPTDKNYPEGVNYPSYRGVNKLIVYTSKWGRKSTGTNVWGVELTVINNIVTYVGGNDKEIPTKGMVISGHGEKRKWLVENVVVGEKVIIDEETKKIVFTRDWKTEINRMRIALATFKNKYTELRQGQNDIADTEIKQLFTQAEKILSGLENKRNISKNIDNKTKESLNELGNWYTKTFYLLTRSLKVELRGVWHWPDEKSRDEVARTVKRLKDNGFNAIFLQTFYHGYVIYPTSSVVTELRPSLNGFDLLNAFSEECKNNGIELHLWVGDFFVGHDEYLPPGPVITKHPEWRMIDKSGTVEPFKDENGAKYYFVSPALPEVQTFLLNLYKEMVTRYDVAGLHLDYIRYPHASEPYGFGYDDYSCDSFRTQFGVDPRKLTPEHQLWTKWCDWRREQVTRFVKSVRKEICNTKSGLKLSAAVFADPEDAKNSVLQDWTLWLKEGLLDFIAPMSYYSDAQDLKLMTMRVMEVPRHKNIYIYPGIGTFLKLTGEEIVNQVETVHNLKLSGMVFFDWNSFTDDKLKLIRTSVFRNDASIPIKIR